ncbi:thioredoxin family protein [bacterium F11]|nr:thioredoxin family protein [bacterium F11]
MKKWIGISVLIGVAGLVILVNLSARGRKSLNSLSLHQKAPDFTLIDIKGKSHSLSSHKGKYVVLEWINHGCPYVKKHYNTGNMQELQKEMTKKDVVWFSICSSAKGKQGHYSMEEWNKISVEKNSMATAVLIDEKGTVGRSYGAKTTPHMYIIGPEGTVIYQGAIDDKASTDEDDVPIAKNFVRLALNQVLNGKSIVNAQTVAYGCSVKYE